MNSLLPMHRCNMIFVPLQDQSSGRWIAPKPLGADSDTLKPCPDCSTPAEGVYRYKRLTNKAKVT